MDNKKKIYLSGKISGDPNFKEKFAQKEKELTEQGFSVFNPALHPDMFTWEQFMELDLMALGNCDAIYLLDDWKDSRGAKIEYDEAVKLGKEVLYDKEHSKNIEQNIKAEIVEYKSFKFRITLDDGSITPWQYSDQAPSKDMMEDVKNYYTNRNLEKLLEKKLSRDVTDYKPARNREERDSQLLQREIEMKSRLEKELKNKVFQNKQFLIHLKNKYKDIYGMANHFAKTVKDNLVKTIEIER